MTRHEGGHDRKDPHAWLDRVIAEQQSIQGPAVTSLIAAAAEAQELFGEDELEQFSKDQTRRATDAAVGRTTERWSYDQARRIVSGEVPEGWDRVDPLGPETAPG